MFVYKDMETIEYVKKQSTFQDKCKLYGNITPEFLGVIMQNFRVTSK